MPKVRSPNRDKAFEIYKQHKGDILLVDIAKELDEATGTIRGWKSKDKWDDKLNGTFQTKNMERSVKKDKKSKDIKNKSSLICTEKNNVSIMDTKEVLETNTQRKNINMARPGNKNALGNKGGMGAPLKNKNALVTGEYSTILFEDLYDEKELALLNMELDFYGELKGLLKKSLIRELRFECKIKELREYKQKLYETSVVTTESETDGEFHTTNNTTEKNMKDIDDKILRFEEALTRVQASISRTLEKIHKFSIDYEKLDIEKERLKLYKNKLNNIVDLDELIAPEFEDL